MDRIACLCLCLGSILVAWGAAQDGASVSPGSTWQARCQEINSALDAAATDRDRLDAIAALEELHATLWEAFDAGQQHEDLLLALVGASRRLVSLRPSELTGGRSILQEALDACIEADCDVAQAWAILYLAEEEHRAGRLGEAQKLLQSGADLPSPATPWIRLRLAGFSRLSNTWSEALQWLRSAESLQEQADQPQLFSCYLAGELFQHHLDLGLPDLAAAFLQAERERVEDANAVACRQALVLHELAYALAIDDLESALAIAGGALADPTLRDIRAQILFRLGIAELERARISSAGGDQGRNRLLEALATGELDEYESLRAELFLTSIEIRRDDAAAAGRWLEQAGRRLEAWAARGESRPPPRQMALFSALRGLQAFARGAGTAELKTLLSDARAGFAAFLEEWEASPERPGGIGYLHFTNEQLIVEHLIRLTLAADGSELGTVHAFEDVLRAQAVGSLARRLGAPRDLTLEQVRRLLVQPDHALLLYWPSQEQSFVFLVHRERIQLARLEPLAKLARARAQLMAELAERPARDADGSAAARELARLLIPPAFRTRMLALSSLTVAGLDLLGWLPFECLPFPGARPVGLEMSVDTLPSLPLGCLLAQREELLLESSGAARRGVLLVAAPEQSRRARGFGLADLGPHLRREHLEALREACGGLPFQVLRGQEATWANLARESAHAGALHILTHGVFDPFEDPSTVRERPAGLVLAPHSCEDDGLVWCDDVEHLAPAPPLVVLSSCGAARGPVRQGDDGVAHLGGAFLAAGAQTVLLSRADLDLEATLELTTRFTRLAVAGGLSPARALMQARRELVAHHPDWAHPYYHCLLQVLGLGQRPVFAGSSASGTGSWFVAAACGAAVLALAVLLSVIARRRP
ncbi:MAG: CHAT domain-containing protein [Planctomycetota bacterium]